MELISDRFERLIAHSMDIVVATDRRGHVVYYNDGASRVLGYAPAEVLGQFVGRLYPDLGEARRVMTAMRNPSCGGPGVVEAFRTTFATKSGQRVPVAISGSVLYDEVRREEGTIGFAKDLREILRADQLATLGEVAIGLSHEIKNPLEVITNQAELLERDIERLADERDSSVEFERIDAMHREVRRIAGILDRLEQLAAGDRYETAPYCGPAKMVDLRPRRERRGIREPRFRGLRILVADDDLGIRTSLAELLAEEGCVVSTACDGREALRQLEHQAFDLLLSDVAMPHLDGHELFSQVRRGWPRLPVLMMTSFSYDRDHVLKRSRLEGLEGVLFKKPIEAKLLFDTIATALAEPIKEP